MPRIISARFVQIFRDEPRYLISIAVWSEVCRAWYRDYVFSIY